MKWKIIPIIILTSLLFVACSDDTSTTTNNSNDSESTDMTDTESNGILELTLDELAEFDGKDGNPAYIAVDGKIYDVTDIPVWTGGDHNGFTAGRDLSNEFPHADSQLDYAVEIGVLVANATEEETAVSVNDDDSNNIMDEASDDAVDADSDEAMDDTMDDTSDDPMDDTTDEDSNDAMDDTMDDASDDPMDDATDEDSNDTMDNAMDGDSNNTGNLQSFTLAELEQYTGKDGMPAYIAFDGYVYDVSTLSMWSNGYHNGIVAGFDLTGDIQYAPHGEEMLDNATLIGILE